MFFAIKIRIPDGALEILDLKERTEIHILGSGGNRHMAIGEDHEIQTIKRGVIEPVNSEGWWIELALVFQFLKLIIADDQIVPVLFAYRAGEGLEYIVEESITHIRSSRFDQIDNLGQVCEIMTRDRCCELDIDVGMLAEGIQIFHDGTKVTVLLRAAGD